MRIHFVEQEFREPGRSVFDLPSLDKKVLKLLDVFNEMGGKMRCLIDAHVAPRRCPSGQVLESRQKAALISDMRRETTRVSRVKILGRN